MEGLQFQIGFGEKDDTVKTVTFQTPYGEKYDSAYAYLNRDRERVRTRKQIMSDILERRKKERV